MAFVTPTAPATSSFTPKTEAATTPLAPVSHAKTRMTSSTYVYNPLVDHFFAKDVRNQYIAKACPSGVPPLQCIESSTFDAAFELRTFKRQKQLRYRQLPTSVKLNHMYETRQMALIACHGCSHEESRVVNNPILASSMTLGQAEMNRACSRYIESGSKEEEYMYQAVEKVYDQAFNGSGVYSGVCSDGQVKYEAYQAQVRGKAVEYRAKQYSASMKEGAKFAARKMAIARKHVCVYEDGIYAKYAKVAGAMRPAFGYYTPYVSLPSEYMYAAGVVPMADPSKVDAAYKLTALSSSTMKMAAGY